MTEDQNRLVEEAMAVIQASNHYIDSLRFAQQGVFSTLAWSHISEKVEGARIWCERSFSAPNIALQIDALQYAHNALVVVAKKAQKEIKKGRNDLHIELGKELFGHIVIAMELLMQVITSLRASISRSV